MLTNTVLKNLCNKPHEKIMREKDRDGLYVRISTKGKVTFYMRYRFCGKSQDMDLGTYPRMSLKEARKSNEKYRGMLEQGKNPKIEKRIAQQEISDDMLFSELFELWYEKECKPSIKRHTHVYNQVTYNTAKKCKGLPASKLSTHFWLDLLEDVKKRAPAVAGKLLGHLNKIYYFGIRRRLLTENPLIGLNSKRDLHIVNNTNDRYLSDDEIRLLFVYLKGTNKFTLRNQLLIRFAIIYGCRMGEVSATKRSHFDFDTMVWTLPAECHKTGHVTNKPLVRPIIKEMVPIINELSALSLNKEYLISGPSGEAYLGGFWSSWPSLINKWLKKNGHNEIDLWGVHTLRKTMRTNISPLTINMPHVAEKMIGHKLQGVWSVYDHYDYLDEQREVYTAWWNKLERILANTDNVVEIKRACP